MLKRFPSILFFCTVLLLAGCQTDPATEVAEGKYLTVSIENTRTALGDKVGDNYLVYWSADDQIVVNGELSGKAQINNDNKGVASFLLSDNVEYPYSITYPYCTSTIATAPVVEFPTEQSYVKGSYDAECAPMCGYAEEGKSVALRHLSTILRFPIKGIVANTILERVVVTSSTAKLAGEFAVDCQNGTIEATSTATNSVTYTVNQTLSTSEEIVLYISLPAVNAGDCSVEFIDSEGGKMSAKWSAEELKSGVIREFKGICYVADGTCSLTPLYGEEDVLDIPYHVFGKVEDNAGNPIEGVAVSDGFTVVATDSNGYYQIENVSHDTWYIFISLPSEYEVPTNEYGQPCFYKKYSEFNSQYNFTLTPMKGGKEDKFALFAFGDPQVSNAGTKLVRFNNESVPSIRKHGAEIMNSGMRCYGITLGDIVSNGTGNSDEYLRDDMRNGFAVSKTGFPVFQVMGNHDYTYCDESKPLITDSRSSTLNLKAQRNHEDMFGPANYSFNRGDFHIVGMKDIYYQSATSGGTYVYGFTAEQYEWLKQDLALVPKDKAVVLCVHIQMLSRPARYFREVKNLLNEFNDAHILSGHTHINRNYEHAVEGLATTKIYEHNAGALCGAWWTSNVCVDGTPNGYQVFICDNDSNGGGKIVNWYFRGVNEGMNDPNHQMRLYWGNAITGGPIPEDAADNANGKKGYYGFNYGENVLLANVYNADSKWEIKVYEDDEYTGNMVNIKSNTPAFSKAIGDYTITSPLRFADNTEPSYEMYTIGYYAGVRGLWDTTNNEPDYSGSCLHLYKYTLKNPKNRTNIKDIEIKVVAIDRFGKEYTETNITEGTDYTLIQYN